jgi:hypothetical protein
MFLRRLEDTQKKAGNMSRLQDQRLALAQAHEISKVVNFNGDRISSFRDYTCPYIDVGLKYSYPGPPLYLL